MAMLQVQVELWHFHGPDFSHLFSRRLPSFAPAAAPEPCWFWSTPSLSPSALCTRFSLNFLLLISDFKIKRRRASAGLIFHFAFMCDTGRRTEQKPSVLAQTGFQAQLSHLWQVQGHHEVPDRFWLLCNHRLEGQAPFVWTGKDSVAFAVYRLAGPWLPRRCPRIFV